MKAWMGMAAVVVGASLAAWPARAVDGSGGRRGHGPHGPGPERVTEFLGLTDEQKASWDQMREEFHAALEPLVEQQRASADKLRQALEAEQPDPLAVGKLVVSMHQQRKQTETQHEALQQRLRATLTPEQQVKFDAAQALSPHPGLGDFGLGRGFGPRMFAPGHPRGPRGEGWGGGAAPLGRRGSRPQRPGF